MTKETVLVASPSAIGRTPVASGSSVPAWPAFLAAKARLTIETACVEVMLIGLSRTTQPSTLRFSRRRCAGGAFDEARESVIAVFALVQVASDRGCSQKLLDPFRFVESLVEPEANVRSKFQVNAPGDFSAEIFLVAIERSQHLLLVAPAERNDVDGGEPEIGTHPHLGHGDHVSLDHGVVHLAARQNLGHGVPHELAGAQCTLRRDRFRFAMRSARHVCHRYVRSNGGSPTDAMPAARRGRSMWSLRMIPVAKRDPISEEGCTLRTLKWSASSGDSAPS